jgi:DNA-binding NtrC family response regulator
MKMNKQRLAKLQEFLRNIDEPETPDKGYYTATELSEMMGIPRNTLLHKIRKLKMQKSDKLDIKYFNVRCSDALRKLPHYKFNF